MNEKQLIKACIKQDRRAQNELYKKYFPLMSSIALRYTENEQDVLANINGGFFKVLKNIKKYNSEYALATWIRNILVNHMIDEFRKQKKYIANVHIEINEDMGSADFNLGEAQLHEEDLRRLLQKLPDVTQKVFNMYAIDGFKHKEIATAFSISEGTSKWHVSDARKKLRGLIAQQVQDEKKTFELRA